MVPVNGLGWVSALVAHPPPSRTPLALPAPALPSGQRTAFPTAEAPGPSLRPGVQAPSPSRERPPRPRPLPASAPSGLTRRPARSAIFSRRLAESAFLPAWPGPSALRLFLAGRSLAHILGGEQVCLPRPPASPPSGGGRGRVQISLLLLTKASQKPGGLEGAGDFSSCSPFCINAAVSGNCYS